MKKAGRSRRSEPAMRAEYEIPWDKAERGKYASRFKGVLFVPIDPELQQFFPDQKAVNAALHALVAIARRDAKAKPRRKSA